VRLVDGDCFGMAVVEASRVCGAAVGGQVLLSDATRLLARDRAAVREVGTLALKGLPDPSLVWEAEWSLDDRPSIRAVLADDAVLVREGIAHVLESAGIEVVGQAGDGEEVLRLTAELQPDLAVIDVRMPPTYGTEGLDVAKRIRAEYPHTAVLVLTQELEPRYAAQLLDACTTGVGYLLKENVTNLAEFTDDARRVAAGGRVFAPGLLPAGVPAP
jgi:serine/threonine-protein kinase PknK